MSDLATSRRSAARMRRLRERQKTGSILVRFEMAPAAVDRLVALGWLTAKDRHDWRTVTEAFLKFGTRALWPDQ